MYYSTQETEFDSKILIKILIYNLISVLGILKYQNWISVFFIIGKLIYKIIPYHSET